MPCIFKKGENDMSKKWIAMLLALCMLLGILAGCGGGPEDAASVPPAESAQTAAPAVEDTVTPEPPPAEDPDSAGEPASNEEPVVEAPTNEFYSEHIGVKDYELPLFDEELTLSVYWVQLGAMGGAEQPLKKDLLFWQRVQEATGVTLDFQQRSEAVCAEQYNLMIASGDMTDLIYESNCGQMGSTSVYNGGYDKAIEDDIYVDLTDLIPEFAPNYWALLEGDDNLRKDLTTDTGRLYSMGMIYDQPQGIREGPLVRKDYLEATGLPDPVTTEDWLEVFKAMKENGVLYPMGVSNGGDIRGGFFMNAFGTAGGHSYKVDLATNELVYDGTSDELRDFVEFFHEAFAAGMVDPDYAYQQMFDTSRQIAGEVGLFGGMDRDLTNFKESYDMDLKAVPMTFPEGSEAPKMYSYEYAKQRNSGMKNIVITTNCEEPEKAVTFLDWFYSTDGASAVNFGFNEGESYEVVNGVKQWLPQMLERNDELVSYEVIYALDEGPGVQLVNKRNPVNEDYVIEAKDIWLSYDATKAVYGGLPTLSFTAKESEDMSAVNLDIYTTVSTEISRFMMGEAELTDESWDAYCKQIEDMGLEGLTEFYQTAYERYEER